jgi:hypothetical protein
MLQATTVSFSSSTCQAPSKSGRLNAWRVMQGIQAQHLLVCTALGLATAAILYATQSMDNKVFLFNAMYVYIKYCMSVRMYAYVECVGCSVICHLSCCAVPFFDCATW